MSKAGKITYTLRPTGFSSQRFGPCNICGKHATEVYSQTKWQGYTNTKGEDRQLHKDSAIGHEDCLRKARRRRCAS